MGGVDGAKLYIPVCRIFKSNLVETVPSFLEHNA